MSVTIKTNKLAVKNPITGNFDGLNIVGDTTTAEMISRLNVEANSIKASFPSDYAHLVSTATDQTTTFNDTQKAQARLNIAATSIMDMNDFFAKATGVEKIEWNTGGYINSGTNSTVPIDTITSSNSYIYSVINCQEGDIFWLNANGASAARPWCFIDNTNARISYENNQVGTRFITEGIIIAPAGATKLVINNQKNTNPNYVCYKGTIINNDTYITKADYANGINKIKLDFIYGCYLPYSDMTHAGFESNWSYTKVQCCEGDQFTVIGEGGSSGRLWAFFDKNGTLLTVAAGDTTAEEAITVTAPENAAWFTSNSHYTVLEGEVYKIMPHITLLERINEVNNNCNDSIEALQNKLDEINTLNALVPYATNVTPFTNWESGWIDTYNEPINPSVINTSTNYVHAIINCSEGDKFYINVYGAANGLAYCFLSDSNVAIARTTPSVVNYTKASLIAPAGATKLILNNDLRQKDKPFCYVGASLNASNYALNEDIEAITGCESIHFITGYYMDTSGTNVNLNAASLSTNWAYAKAPCVVGDIFNVIGYGADAGRLWAFTNNAGEVLSCAESNLSTEEFITVTAPQNAVWFIANTRYTNIPGKVVKGILPSANTPISNTINENQFRPLMENNYNLSYAHCAEPLSLTNCYGNTQNVHPKVVYIENGFGGHKWWLAYTPYPGGATQYENPCIAYSDDGINWTNIPDNPIDTPQEIDSEIIGYMSDTHLLYKNGVLECWYRLANTGASPYEEVIYRKQSSDGLTWGTREQVYKVTDASSPSRCLSPVVIWEDNKYKMWYVYYLGKVVASSRQYIQYCECSDTTNWTWTLVRQIKLPYIDNNGLDYRLWHIDIEKVDGKYYLVSMCKGGHQDLDNPAADTQNWSLFWAMSDDNITYTVPKILMYGNTNGWDKYMYRSCILKVKDTWYLYYSALDASSKHYMALSTGRSIDRLIGTNWYNATTLITSNPYDTKSASNSWHNKNLVVFGDSRTWYHGHLYTANTKSAITQTTCTGYIKQLEKILDANIINEGVSGDNSKKICDRIKAYDFTNIDVVLLEGGVNDFYAPDGQSIGTISPIGNIANVNTAYGAWQSAIEYITTNYPNVEIYMTVPAIAWNVSDTIFPYETAKVKKDVAELYNIPYVDLYKTAGITTKNRDTFYADIAENYGWVHFNDAGNEKIGKIIANFLKNY